jgi:hypothetical protein
MRGEFDASFGGSVDIRLHRRKSVCCGAAHTVRPSPVCCSLLMLGVILFSMAGCAAGPSGANERALAHETRVTSAKPDNFAGKPPFSATDLWSRLLALLNESNGSVTKERLENGIGITLHQVAFQPDAIVYGARARRDGYLTAHLVVYNEQHRSPNPVRRGAHVQWYVGWDADDFGDPARGECLTAARASTDLLASGWTSPWPKPGTDEARLVSPSPPIEPHYMFGRQSDERDGHSGRLPRGQLFSSGDSTDSCITGILLVATP